MTTRFRNFAGLLLLLTLPLPLLAQAARSAEKPPLLCGVLTEQVLRCRKFGFTYKVILGWVDRTQDMQQDEGMPSQPASAPPPSTVPEQAKPARSDSPETLLAVFERPPEASGETINSAVVIAAEPQANYHGLKTAADYFGAISELAQQRGFKVVNEPYAFSVGAKPMVRGEFSKERGKLTMWQSSLVMIEKGYIVSFTFIGGSEDEVNELVANLNFMTGNRRQDPLEPILSTPHR